MQKSAVLLPLLSIPHPGPSNSTISYLQLLKLLVRQTKTGPSTRHRNGKHRIKQLMNKYIIKTVFSLIFAYKYNIDHYSEKKVFSSEFLKLISVYKYPRQ